MATLDDLHRIEDELMELHICDQDGNGCDYEYFEAYGTTHYRCKLRRQGLEEFLNKYQPKTQSDYPAGQYKVHVIKSLHELLGFNLADTKTLVDYSPNFKPEHNHVLTFGSGPQHNLELVHTEIENLIELAEDDIVGDWTIARLRLLANKLLPRGHKDYWKYHCKTCGLWLNGESDQDGYCQCE